MQQRHSPYPTPEPHPLEPQREPPSPAPYASEPLEQGSYPPLEPLPPIPKQSALARVKDYFLGQDPTLLSALVPSCLASIVLFTRSPKTNFIFDEQEALLANPYVRAASDTSLKIGWLQAFRRDFWGLLPDRTIGSYRPLPDILWRALWKIGARDQGAFPQAYLNVMLHGLNAALVVLLVARWTRDRLTAWLAGAFFLATAVVTEAVTGVVGLADVLGGTGALLALLSLGMATPRRPASLAVAIMPVALFFATLLGLFSKESALCIVPLAPLAALMTAQAVYPERPRPFLRALLAGAACLAAFVVYVELRRRLFPVATPHELTAEANRGRSLFARAWAAGLRWYAQPALPRDPLNNPLVSAPFAYRVAGALRVFARGLGQLFLPRTLSGDYSAPQEPVPSRLVFPESVAGGIAMAGLLLACPVLAWVARRRGTHLQAAATDSLPLRGATLLPLVGFAMAWIAISYFPVSNIPVVLPTVRAERFWYFPAIGSAMLLAMAFSALARRAGKTRYQLLVATCCVLYLALQAFQARRHAFDYTDDLVFWDATRKAVPRSAKAHLNYSVMLGARGDLAGRLASNRVALELAPKWPMANVYLGDTLCRLHRSQEALPHYLHGFSLGPNDLSLVALGLQCLWDEHQLSSDSPVRSDLQTLADQHPGSWLKYLVDDTFENGEENSGVNPKYRPRGYNEGPKKED